MSTPAALRTLRLRQPRAFRHLLPRNGQRNASTTEKATEKASEAAAKSKETATSLQSKASEGLTRVQSAAGPALSGAARGVGNALGRIGGRTGRLISAVESAIPPTIYYSKVTLEVARLIFQGQKMAPPSVQTFQSYFTPILHALRHPSSILPSTSIASASPAEFLARVRSVDRTQMAGAGVILAELVGFFTVGEMIGRMKIVGYRGEAHHGH